LSKAGNQEVSRSQETITRLASIVIFAARSEASVYLGDRSHDSLGQVLVFQCHHLTSDKVFRLLFPVSGHWGSLV
jgi:hypothetical protein